MKRKWIILIIIAIAILCGIGVLVRFTTTQAEVGKSVRITTYVKSNPPTVAELLKLVNEERTKVGVAPLTIDSNVQKSAQLKADDMHNRDYFSHIIKGTDSVITPEMGALLNSSCSGSSENISWVKLWSKYGNTSHSIVTGWVNSSEHYRAMINPDYTLTGFGIAGDKVVEHFCIAK